MSVRVSVEEQDASKPRTECRTATVRINQASAHRICRHSSKRRASRTCFCTLFYPLLGFKLQVSILLPEVTAMVLTTATSACYLMYIRS